MDTRIEKSIYVKTLLWAYEKHHAGFTKEEMKSAVGLADQEWVWIEWMFYNGLSGAGPLIWSIEGNHYGEKFYLSATGIAAAVDYLELKEMQKSGRVTTVVAITAIIISIFVGIAQIYFSLDNSRFQSGGRDYDIDFFNKK